VAELQERMSSLEFAEWMEFGEIEPWGEERADVRAAIVASTVANANRDPKARKKPFTVGDFMPKFGEPAKRRQTWQEQLAMAEMLTEALGGTRIKAAPSRSYSEQPLR
jgi:hypothetical protein